MLKKPERPSGSIHGAMVIDKPSGMTSHDVVIQLRRHFRTRRIGHAGTLDPMATGVLVVLLGEATKLSQVLTTDRKTYLCRVSFGKATDSLDLDGKVLRYQALSPGWLEEAALCRALDEERARTLQVPPLVSAIKVDGERSYDRARRGESLELLPRDVAVHDLELLDWSFEHASLRLTVSKGYYVRSFARDLGTALGVPAHLSSLRREKSGPFGLELAESLPPRAEALLLSLTDTARRALPALELSPEGAVRARHGKLLGPSDFQVHENEPARDELLPFGTPVALLFHGELVALAERSKETSLFQIIRGFLPVASGEPEA